MKNKKIDIYKSSRLWYIVEATVEYFVSVLVGTNYLAYLATAIGIDDGTVGILTSFVSLGCGFQIFALFIRGNRPVKRIVTLANLANQLCFTFLYVTPLIDLPSGTKTVIFIILLLSGHILLNVMFSPKVNWFRSLIPEGTLGRFSTACETVSLVSGMVFTTAMGALIDYFEAKGDMTAVFILCGSTLAVLTIFHTLCMLLIKEKKPDFSASTEPVLPRIKHAITDRATLSLIPVFLLWNFALYGTTSFFYTYAQNELGFNMTFISILSALYAVVRSVSSIPLGFVGDKRSFVSMMSLGMLAMAIGLGFNSFGGAVNYCIYYMLYAVALAGTNSAKMNLIFSCVSPEKRTGAVAILYTIGGFTGFFASLIMKPLFDYVKANGNSFLGIENIYPQQVLSVVGIIIIVITLLYINFVVRRIPRPHSSLATDNA